MNEYEHRVGIIIRDYRYQCKNCGNAFGEEFDAVDKAVQFTKRLKMVIQRECFERNSK